MSDDLAWPCKIGPKGLQPCHALDDVLEVYGTGSRYQGIKLQTLVNMKSGDFSRHLVVVKSGKHSKKGIVLNLCPFCGEELVAGVKADIAAHAAKISSEHSPQDARGTNP